MRTVIFVLFTSLFFITASSQKLSVEHRYAKTYFPLVHQSKAAGIYVDPSDYKVVSIAAKALQQDITDITGQQPQVSGSTSLSSYPVIIGTIGHSRVIDSLIALNKLNVDAVINKWEAFTLQVIDHPLKNVKQALVIAGADRRGTAFGAFELSKILGVSPWKWWADVHPEKHASVYLRPGTLVQGSPSVKYRGIFINDEDWGLQPWAAENMDPTIKDIGPNTYAKVFELLLRLKANFIWPAMHPCTRAFYYYKENPQVADDYAIVVGSSHAEPMLRNNVFEWVKNFENEYGHTPGEWRYDSNGKEILRYWGDRVEQSKNSESVYTIGMRGVHDSGMPGPKSMQGKLGLLQTVIGDQRNLLQNSFQKDPATVPQIFCPYKEVLDIYRNGLNLPDDVTIVWADDNHGYIRQLSNKEEQNRSGRSGIYYHLSYWGSPHDYLWLCSVSPALISYEMSKAYAYGADRLWVFNVGDIKPAEMELEFAMDLGWDVNKWTPENAYRYPEYWAAATFGDTNAKEIGEIKNIYYRLAASAKPEHLGMRHFSPEEENERLRLYNEIATRCEILKTKIPQRLQDAFFETLFYPVHGAKLMNEKMFYAKRSLQTGVSADSAKYYANAATAAFQQIQALTDKYNHDIAGGKWNDLMSWHPRDLPVYFMPKLADKNFIDSLRKLPPRGTPVDSTSWRLVIDAANFSSKKETESIHFTVINSLGVNGRGITTLPFHYPRQIETDHAPHLQYAVRVPAGKHTIHIRCLPTQSIDADHRLNFGVSVNDGPVQLVNVHAESESRQWKENVIRGYSEGRINFENSSPEITIKIYFPDPGLVVNTIEIE